MFELIRDLEDRIIRIDRGLLLEHRRHFRSRLRYGFLGRCFHDRFRPFHLRDRLVGLCPWHLERLRPRRLEFLGGDRRGGRVACDRGYFFAVNGVLARANLLHALA